MVKAVTVALSGMLLLTGCTTQSGSIEGSRATLYESVATLAADSDLVVAATVNSQTKRGLNGSAGTASTLSRDGGSEIVVLQYGDDVVSSTAPLLRTGASYLLFLTQSDRADEFYVTSVSAGIYELTAKGFEWRGVDADTLPAVIADGELAMLLS